MERPDYPSNSKMNRPAPAETPEPADERSIEPVVEGTVVRRKQPLGKRFVKTFFGGEDAKGVLGYVMQQILVPAAKDMLTDAVSQGFERMVYGESRSASRRTGARTTNGNPYTNYSRGAAARREEPRGRELSRRDRANHRFDQIIIATRAEADQVISKMFDYLEKYDQVTVSDLYRLVDITPSYTDQDWGWTDGRHFDVRRVRDGYLLDLPDPEPLK